VLIQTIAASERASFTADDITAGITLDDAVALLGCQVTTDDPVLIQRLLDQPLLLGDDVMDCWQGIYWLLKQRHLLAHPRPDEIELDLPIISVGSGPSLDENIDELRKIQKHVYISAAHSAVERLLEANIVPDFTCPVERVDPALFGMPSHPLPSQTVYCGLPIVPREPDRCQSRLCCSGADMIYPWAGYVKGGYTASNATGPHSVTTAAQMTTRPIYLVGHDLVDGYRQGYPYTAPEPGEVTVPCYDGVNRPINQFRLRARAVLEAMAPHHPLIQTSRQAAAINGIPFEGLPITYHLSTPKQVIYAGPRHPGRRLRADALALGLPSAFEHAAARVLGADSPQDLHPSALGGDDYAPMFGYLLRPLYSQLRITKALVPTIDTTAWFKEAFANIIDGLIAQAEDVAHA